MTETHAIRRKLWLWGSSIVLLLAIACAYLIFWMYGEAAREKADALAREAGLPTELSVLRLPPLPDEENAALELFELVELTRHGTDAATEIDAMVELIAVLQPAPVVYPELWSVDTQVKPALLADFGNEPLREVMDTIERMTDKPGYSPDLEWEKGYDLPLPHLSKARLVVRLLCLRAWLRADAGDTAAATDDLVRALRVGGYLQDESTLISQLVVMACDVISVNASQAIIRQVGPEAFATADLQRLVDAISPHRHLYGQPGMQAGYRGEYIFITHTIEQVQAGEVSIWLDDSLQPPNLLQAMGAHLWNPMLNQERLFITQVYIEALENTAKPIYSADYQQPFEAVAIPKYYVLSRILLGILSRVDEKAVGHQAELAVAQDGLRLILHARANRGYPTAAHDVIGLSLDPFTGSPLGYQRTDDGFKLWSVGMDGIDGGGIPHHDGRQADIVFQIGARPELDPQPPEPVDEAEDEEDTWIFGRP